MNPDPHDLIQRHMAAQLTEEEAAFLQTRLKADADLRKLYLHYMNLDVALEAQAESRDRVNDLLRAAPLTEPGSQRRWLSWRPLTVAAAGIVFGVFCTSMVFAYVGPSLGKVMSLLHESFESGPAPLVTGMPQELNLWSGDYSEIVETYEAVKPAQGTKMARMLRSDFEGKTSSKPSLLSDLMRVVDVRPFLREANGGEVVITLSAFFNAAPFPDAERCDGMVTLWALGPRFPTEENLMEDALAHSVGYCRPLDRDPATWQSASVRLLVPPGTEMVLLKVSFSPVPASGASLSPLPDHVTFAGHFVDEVRASVSIRHAVSDQRVNAVHQGGEAKGLQPGQPPSK